LRRRPPEARVVLVDGDGWDDGRVVNRPAPALPKPEVAAGD
jgi:hypothetical protein